jgi:hypothetical protein
MRKIGGIVALACVATGLAAGVVVFYGMAKPVKAPQIGPARTLMLTPPILCAAARSAPRRTHRRFSI